MQELNTQHNVDKIEIKDGIFRFIEPNSNNGLPATFSVMNYRVNSVCYPSLSIGGERLNGLNISRVFLLAKSAGIKLESARHSISTDK